MADYLPNPLRFGGGAKVCGLLTAVVLVTFAKQKVLFYYLREAEGIVLPSVCLSVRLSVRLCVGTFLSSQSRKNY